ncbi:MAG TPA: DUF11 domain-containing protein, partial [bacterium]|nr:DUF11 domain-containing protein [bacterium]
VVDCAPEQEGAYDYPAAVFDAGVGGISGGDLCNQVFLQLTLSKTDGLAGSCIAHGDTLTYTITYGNTRNTLDVHGVVLVDSLPYQTSFVSASGGGTYDSGSRIVTWQIGTLGGGVQGTQSVRLMAGAPQGSSISNVCSIVSDETPATAATRTTMVCYAQTRPLSIAKTAVLSGGCVSRGANLTYSITYSNPNAYEVRGVTLTDDLPSQTEFVSASAGGSYDAGARRVTWALGGLPAKAGGSQEVTIIVNAVEGATFTNSCAITSDETGPSQASRTILVCGYGSGRNGQHKIVVHVKSHPTSCTKNYPTFTNCNQIQTTYPGVGDLDALPVFYDLTEYTVTEFGLRWPSAWGSCSFVRCKGDLAIGGISNPGDGIAIAWTACQHTWAIVPGFAWLSAMGGGGISVCADPATGDVGVVDCQPEPGPYYDHPSALLRAGVGGVVGDNPCAGPARIEGTSWGAIKAMFK